MLAKFSLEAKMSKFSVFHGSCEFLPVEWAVLGDIHPYILSLGHVHAGDGIGQWVWP